MSRVRLEAIHGSRGWVDAPWLDALNPFSAVIKVSSDALRDGCERARDVFLLNRLRSHADGAAGLEATFHALGVDPVMRDELQRALTDVVPVKGLPELELMAVGSMVAGVLVGLLIADSTLPAEELDLPVTPAP